MKMFAAVVILVSCGCGLHTPRAEEISTADYGQPIAQENAVKQATLYLETVLKDPESMRAQWGQVQKVWWKNEFQWGYQFGYVLLGMINAKNSFGGYVGAKQYQFYFRDGSLMKVLGGSD